MKDKCDATEKIMTVLEVGKFIMNSFQQNEPLILMSELIYYDRYVDD